MTRTLKITKRGCVRGLEGALELQRGGARAGREWGLWCALLLVVLTTAGGLSAQQSLSGVVRDAASGEMVSGAQIEVEGVTTNLKSATRSGRAGRFSIVGLTPGEFTVSVSGSTYATETARVDLKPRESAVLEVMLRPTGANRETIEVSATVRQLDPARAQTSIAFGSAELDELPAAGRRDLPSLVAQVTPGAVVGHDNFIHLKGNELSIHQFVDGVAFLDNANTHFTPGASPRMIESVNIITGGMAAEFGNRLGGVLDIVTKSGRSFHGGSVTLGGGTILARDAGVEYGVGGRKWDLYFGASAFSDGRFLNPPQPAEIHDLGYGANNFLKLGHNPTDRDRLTLVVSTAGTNFQLPNTTSDFLVGRDASRRTRMGSAVARWQRTLSPSALVTTSVYHRYVSDRLSGTSDPITPLANGFRRTETSGAKIDFLVQKGRHTIKAGVDAATFRLSEDLFFDPREADEHGEDEGHAEEDGHHDGEERAEEEEPHEEEPRHEEESASASAIGAAALPALASGGGFPSPIHNEAAIAEINFRGRRRGGQGSFYVQDQFSPFRNFTVHAGIRYDRSSVVLTEDLWSPRLGLSYHIPKTGTVIQAVYNRYFVPPPLEYLQLGSALGAGAFGAEEASHAVRPAAIFGLSGSSGLFSEDDDHAEEQVFNPGAVRALTQHYVEFGLQQRLHSKIVLDVSGYHHQGRHAFENAEISNTRLFVPVNFDRERTWGSDVSLRMKPLGRLGIFGYLNYAHINTAFFGPVSGGIGGHGADAGGRITPAFDQRHTGTASLAYRRGENGFRVGFSTAYGSGTPAEFETEQQASLASGASSLPVPVFSSGGEVGHQLVRLPSHWTFDLWAAVPVWKTETKSIELRFDAQNLGNRIFAIAKESEVTPVQHGGRRRFSAQLRFRF